MKRGKESRNGGMAIMVFITGLLISLTGLLAIIGIPMMIWAINAAFRRRGLWVCTTCGHQVERKIEFYEFG